MKNKHKKESEIIEYNFTRCPYIELGCSKFQSICLMMNYEICRHYKKVDVSEHCINKYWGGK